MGGHIKIVLEMRLLNAQIVVHLMNVRPLVIVASFFVETPLLKFKFLILVIKYE